MPVLYVRDFRQGVMRGGRSCLPMPQSHVYDIRMSGPDGDGGLADEGSDVLLIVLARPDLHGMRALAYVAELRRLGQKPLFIISIPDQIPDAQHQMLCACSEASLDESDLKNPKVFDWMIRYAVLRSSNRELAHGVSISAGRRRELLRMGEMAGQVIHEIGNPLALIKLHASKVAVHRSAGEPLTDEEVRHLQTVQQFSERVEQIVVRTRDHFRPGLHRAFESVLLEEIIDEAMTYARLKAQREGVVLETELRCPVYVRVDRVRIVQAVVNLLSNAIDAAASAKTCAEKAWVCIGVHDAGGMVCVRISDSGKGVAPMVAHRLFQLFATSKSHGSGIGLSLSRAIAREHGGDLRLNDTLPATTFELILPREGSRRPRVLVVDDDAAWRQVVVSELAAYDLDVMQASQIEEAMELLSIAEDLRPDLCVSDFALGGQSVREFMNQAHGAGCDFPFVVMTGYYVEDVAQQLGFVAPVLFKADADFFERLLSAMSNILLKNSSAA